MRRIKYLLIVLVVSGLLLAITGCSLPGLNLLQSTTTPAQGVPTTTANVTPSPTPINSNFNIPVASTTNPISGLPNLADVIAKVRPSVVAINTKVTSAGIFGGTYTQEGAGSGWVIDSSGLIVTNNHVVEGASDITVNFEDGRNFPAESVKTDPVSDLAVIKINAQSLPPALSVGDSSTLRVGDWVIAIGNSLGQGISATKGIVSALGVSVAAENGETLNDLIQTDAAINPGNSGGPLVNLSGQVIGINSIKVSQVGVEGMGYSISSKGAVPIINSLVKDGYISRPWLGVSLYTVDQAAIRQLNLSVDKGVLITQVLANGPADKAGIKKYDVITNFNGKDVSTVEDLVKEIRSYQIGQAVKVTYWRGKNQNTVSITLEQAQN